jgi:hypothetical protein
MAIGDVYRFSVVGGQNGNDVIWTLHAKVLSGSPDPDTFAAGIKTQLLATTKIYWPTTYSASLIRSWQVAAPHAIQEYTTGFPIAGTGNAGGEVNQTALVTTLRSGTAGRSYRGRVYMPGVTVGSMSAGLVGSSIRNAIQTYWDDFIATWGASGSNGEWALVIYSRKLSVGTRVASTLVRNIPGTQHRRRIGVGT